MPEISVIVPVYKVEKYLDICVKSILNQTFADFELWLVDDGSPDNCPQMCDEWAKKDGRINVIHKKNGGLSDARNAALDRMNGKYVTFVDSDDYLTDDAFQILYSAVVNNNADVSVGNMFSIDENDNVKNFYFPASDEKILEGDDLLQTLYQPCAQNRLYKSEIFKKLRFPFGRLYEDVFIYHDVLSQTKKMVLTGRPVYYYRIRSDSIMHSDYSIRFTDIIDGIKARYEWLDSIGKKELANEARLFVYARVAVAYANLDKSIPENKKRLDEISLIYSECYDVLMKEKNISFKQKIRLILLKYFPEIHSKLIGKKMPIALD